jgi:HEAT repeat protein
MNDEESRSPVAAEPGSSPDARDPSAAPPSPSAERDRGPTPDAEKLILGAVEDAFANATTGPGAARPGSDEADVTVTMDDVSVRAGEIRPGQQEQRLVSASPQVRRRRLEQLVATGIQWPDGPELATLLVEDPDPEIRRLAGVVLAGAPRVIPLSMLVIALRDPDDGVRASAIRVAAGYGPIAAPLVLPSVVDRLHPMTQQAALEALPPLLAGGHALGEHDLDLLTRAVGRVDPPPMSSERPQLGALVRALGIGRIVQRLDGPDDRRLGAVRLLWAEGGMESLRPLSQLAGDPVDEIRWAASMASSVLDTLGRPGPPPQRVSRPAEDPGSPTASQPIPDSGDVELIASLARGLTDPEEGVRRQAGRIVSGLQLDILGPWAESALRDARADRARLGAAVVQQTGMRGLARTVLERASGASEDERGPFLSTLASLRLPAEELAGLLSSVDPLYRQSAVRVVWQVGGRAVLPFLPRLLGDSAGPVRMAALEVLSESGDPQGVGLAQRLLAEDSSAAVRATAVHALARTGGVERLAALRLALNDPDPDVRATAIELLPQGFAGHMTDLLVSALRDDDERVWRATLTQLAEVPDRDLSLLWAAIHDNPERKREELLRTLERRRPDRLATLAAQSIRAPEPSARVLAVRMAARAGTPECTTLVVVALEDPDPSVRRAAASAMSTLRTPLGVPALARTLSDPQPDVRIEAVRALGVIDDDTVPEVLLHALSDPEIRVREMVVQILAGWRSPAVAHRLAAALSTPDLRRQVGQVLERMGQAAVGPLIQVVLGTDRATATVAGQVLGRISGPRAFVGDLASTDPERRRQSVEVLGAMGGGAAVEGLLTVLTDPDVQVRSRAAMLLGELGDPRAARPLKRVFTTDPVSDVAAAAEHALRRLGELPEGPQQVPEWPPDI